LEEALDLSSDRLLLMMMMVILLPIDPASNRNEYQEYFLVVKAAGA
jgi:hypothetical protein